LDSTKLLNINKILADPVNYSIDTLTAPLLIYEDIAGNKKKQFRFYITISAQCDTLAKQLAIQELLEGIVTWIEDQEDLDNYPTSGGDFIQVLQVPELFSKDESLRKGIYQVLVNYVYYEYE
jgi:hypothetical protein